METPAVEVPLDVPAGRRHFLARVIFSIQAVIGGAVGAVLGGAVVSPGLRRRAERWLPAGRLDQLVPNQPTTVMLRVARDDGYAQIVERRTVFLIRTGEREVTALDSTCTHLGCRVSWDAEAGELACPCHGGRYDRTGAVTAGPPPAPLASFDARVEDGDVLVRL